jgi:hypothetical protein
MRYSADSDDSAVKHMRNIDSSELTYEILRRHPSIALIAMAALAFTWRGCMDGQELAQLREDIALEHRRESCENQDGEWIEMFDNAGRQDGYQCVRYPDDAE